MLYDVTIDGKNYRLELSRADGRWTCRLDGRELQIDAVLARPDVGLALRSFVPDDIRNGARVVIVDATNALGGLIKYEWRDGKVLDSAGNVAFDSGLTRMNSVTTAPAEKK